MTENVFETYQGVWGKCFEVYFRFLERWFFSGQLYLSYHFSSDW